ncbi:MAG: hypothetical protein L6305_07410 [Actinomycetia bacterium]|nr:hypothetical protein [Actinomycetes bacterium]
MIQFDKRNKIWSISNGYSTYKIGLKDNKCHHICYLPIGLAEKLDHEAIMQKELQPETEISINDEGRIKHHGARWVGCGASNRAEYKSHDIVECEN